MITQIVVDLSDVFPVCAVSLACDGDAAHIVELFLAEPVGREQYAAASVTDDLDDDRIVIACGVFTHIQFRADARFAFGRQFRLCFSHFVSY